MQGRIATVKWTKHLFDDNPEVWVDVAKIEAAWPKDDVYIGPDGCPDDQPGKYHRIGEELAEGLPLNVPWMRLREGEVAFSDGRHRFAWLRDHGADAIPVAVPPGDVDQVETRFGSDLRTTAFRLPGT